MRYWANWQNAILQYCNTKTGVEDSNWLQALSRYVDLALDGKIENYIKAEWISDATAQGKAVITSDTDVLAKLKELETRVKALEDK